MQLNRSAVILATALLICGLGAPLAMLWYHATAQSPVVYATRPTIGGPFALTATAGSIVTERTYHGKIVLVYFGYTYCPDACPTTLNEIAGALRELGPLAERIQPLFITIDPQRDTPKVLAEYVQSFDPRIVGLTGTTSQIAAAAKAYGVYYAPYKAEGVPDGYLMDHTAIVFVMDEDGRFVATFTQDTPAAQMADRLRKLMATTS
ncbi:MAG TPA: SCO family protein [Stellaceae bacterium]|nr:SCO family protein [Stellaceae bacterium]